MEDVPLTSFVRPPTLSLTTLEKCSTASSIPSSSQYGGHTMRSRPIRTVCTSALHTKRLPVFRCGGAGECIVPQIRGIGNARPLALVVVFTAVTCEPERTNPSHLDESQPAFRRPNPASSSPGFCGSWPPREAATHSPHVEGAVVLAWPSHLVRLYCEAILPPAGSGTTFLPSRCSIAPGW
ncbi:hypothetical protein Hypma_006150 [Hypsizygus marmoreus]|uniref:Uncharacterized protein n=1 Tax=Hypsizygus marmoreus TaxID=39966 RepID=A0A369K0G4_HYPMA|nr:hypothetical protein Hypma_006150 [Hypsizygus marmoreus]